MTYNGNDYQARVFHGATKTERRRKILEKGYIDEATFGGIFADLVIDVSFSLPYNPNGKSRQERWYRTVDEQFCKLFATHCGRSADTKPEALEKVIKQPELIPMFDDSRKRFDKFVIGYNNNADNYIESLRRGGERISPAEGMNRWCVNRRVIGRPRRLKSLAATLAQAGDVREEWYCDFAVWRSVDLWHGHRWRSQYGAHAL